MLHALGARDGMEHTVFKMRNTIITKLEILAISELLLPAFPEKISHHTVLFLVSFPRDHAMPP